MSRSDSINYNINDVCLLMQLISIVKFYLMLGNAYLCLFLGLFFGLLGILTCRCCNHCHCFDLCAGKQLKKKGKTARILFEKLFRVYIVDRANTNISECFFFSFYISFFLLSFLFSLFLFLFFHVCSSLDILSK